MTGMSNPFGGPSLENFQIARPNPGSTFKPPHAPKPHDIPDARELFTVQRDLLKAINHFEVDDTKAARREVEAAYRVFNRYLKTYVSPQGGGY